LFSSLVYYRYPFVLKRIILGTTGIDGLVHLQVQASFGKRSKKDQNKTVNKEDKLLGFTSSEAKSFAPLYAFA